MLPTEASEDSTMRKNVRVKEINEPVISMKVLSSLQRAVYSGGP